MSIRPGRQCHYFLLIGGKDLTVAERTDYHRLNPFQATNHYFTINLTTSCLKLSSRQHSQQPFHLMIFILHFFRYADLRKLKLEGIDMPDLFSFASNRRLFFSLVKFSFFFFIFFLFYGHRNLRYLLAPNTIPSADTVCVYAYSPHRHHNSQNVQNVYLRVYLGDKSGNPLSCEML